MKIVNIAGLLWLVQFIRCQEDIDYGLNATAPPGANFDLLGWYVSVPIPDPDDGFASDIKERELSGGYESDYFYTGDDGAMVFWTDGNGVKTSLNTIFVRTELREMLRRGDTSIGTNSPANNWAFSSIPAEAQHLFRGIDGELTATLAVNHVTKTGTDPNWNGRIIIGQIHASENEPCRLYYHKLPNNTNGALYFGHELSASKGGADIYFNLLGNMAVENPADSLGEVKDTSDPEDGIPLDEKFKYSIKVVGNELTVTIYSEDDSMLSQQIVDMTDSGYDDPDNYIYFKAGLYLQDNTFDSDDYAQVSFYELDHTHNIDQYVRDYGLNPDAPPGQNFDLSTWKITEPTPDPTDGWASEVEELALMAGWQSKHFYTGDDGAMVFWSNGEGKTTSSSTSYIRSELREMLRAGDDSIGCCVPANNWVLSSIPESEYSQYRGVDGELRATVAVNHLPTTGTDQSKSGRIVLAQMHARFNEPCRLYYQKLPENSKGALYFSHELAVEKGGEDLYYNLLGKFAPTNPEPYFEEYRDMSDPEDGIALNEKFQFSILTDGYTVTVTILNADGVLLARRVLDISDSGYDDASLYMYFQAGLNLQDNTFDLEDYAQVSFYTLETYHDTSYYKRDYGLDPDAPPSTNFDLSYWKVTEPTEDPNDGWASEVEELAIVGYQSEYFFTGDDGAMVFYSNGEGKKTSENTLFIRSELREMLRAGDYTYRYLAPGNNWILSSVPESYYSQFRGIDGTLSATLAIDHVPTTGTNIHWSGRIVIGQIYANHSQVCRLYYQKLPDNTRGALYFGHDTSEARGGESTYYNLLGNMAVHNPDDFLGEIQDSSDPADGIALGERFRFVIRAEGHDITVTIQTEDRVQLASRTIDISKSGYDDPSFYMFFKAGLYLQDNSFELSDYARVSFYELETEHDTQYFDDSQTSAPVSSPVEDSAVPVLRVGLLLCVLGVSVVSLGDFMFYV